MNLDIINPDNMIFLKQYIKERYLDDPKGDDIAVAYLDYLFKEEFKILETKEGFITFKFQGDACIINDIYTAPEYRKTKGAWRLFNELRSNTLKNPNCKVMIGFSEYLGQGHEHGKGAMKAAGFIKIGQDSVKEIYLRGNW